MLPEHERQRCGSLLVAEGQHVLRAQGIAVVAGLIEPGNDAWLALFAKLGYAELPGIHYVSKRESGEA